jgi:predicted DNA-binding protein with PD1-like motif
MLIYDDFNEESMENITLLLRLDEAKELKEALEELIKREYLKENSSHVHVNNGDYSKEITVSIYNDKTVNEYNEKIKNIIINNKRL